MDSVTNSPGRKAIAIMQTVHKEILFKKPFGRPRKGKNKVLDEEAYVQEIGKIIQRDFFPDMEKVKAQTDYLEAMEKNDTIRLRELYIKYSGGKRPTQERIPSPATFETPANVHSTQQTTTDHAKTAEDDTQSVISETESNKDEKKLRLDAFLNSHTSQDNESFEEIINENEIKLRTKYETLFDAEEASEQIRNKLLSLPSIEDQAKVIQKPPMIDTWGYKNRNHLMFNPDGEVLSKEREMEINRNRQEITHENTRLKVNPFNEIRSKETINELAKNQAKILDGKIGVDGKELVKETPNVGGYGFVRTPSPSPTTMGTPLMTWGEIEGTPFRLDGGDTPLPRSQGPSFKMSEPPRREQIAFALAEKVGEKNRDQKQRALAAQRRKFSEASPRPNTSTTERLATMSPAARKLATSKLKIGLNSDLRSTYSPLRTSTPLGTMVRTPNTSTRIPKSVRTPNLVKTPKVGSKTPKLNLGIKKIDKTHGDISETNQLLTDDLLKISLPSRKRAADFF